MINIAGVVSIVLFYILILAVGIWAGRKKEAGNDSEEEVMLAGRSIGLFVGIFTMTGMQGIYNFNWNNISLIKIDFSPFLLSPIPIHSNMGGRRLHQWYGRSYLYIWLGVVSGTIRLLIELGLWRHIFC